jgi:AraC-like DNA-binding protein
MNAPRDSISKFWCIQPLRQLELQRAHWRDEVFPPHYHDSFEIAVLETGTQMTRCGGSTHAAGPDHVIVIPPGEMHSVTAGGGSWSVRNFFPDARSVRAAAASVAGRSIPEPRFRDPVVYDPELAHLLRRLHDLLETGDCLLEMETVSARTGAELVARHSAARIETPKAVAVPKAAARARDYLAANFDKNISLTELSVIAGLDRFPLVRAFSKHFGLPPHAFLNQLRLLRAKTMLAQGIPPSETASRTGFSDQSHLTRKFKRWLGVTPGQYIRAVCTEPFG